MKPKKLKKLPRRRRPPTLGAIKRIINAQLEAALLNMDDASDVIKFGEFLVTTGMTIIHTELDCQPIEIPSEETTPNSAPGGMSN